MERPTIPDAEAAAVEATDDDSTCEPKEEALLYLDIAKCIDEENVAEISPDLAAELLYHARQAIGYIIASMHDASVKFRAIREEVSKIKEIIRLIECRKSMGDNVAENGNEPPTRFEDVTKNNLFTIPTDLIEDMAASAKNAKLIKKTEEDEAHKIAKEHVEDIKALNNAIKLLTERVEPT